jgi:hypothetical protein
LTCHARCEGNVRQDGHGVSSHERSVVRWVVVVALRIERIKRVTVIAAEWQAFFDALGQVRIRDEVASQGDQITYLWVFWNNPYPVLRLLLVRWNR